MKRHIRLIPFLLLLLHTSLYGQAPVIQWQKTYGSYNGDYPQSIQLTSDGGYIVVGYTEGADGDVVGYRGNVGLGDLWVIKMDATGEAQWKKCLGGTFQELNGDIRQTPDGGYIVLGSSWSIDCDLPGGHGGMDGWLVKLSPAGDIQWQKMLGGILNDYATSISPTADGGYFIGGYTNSKDIPGYHDNNDPYNNFDWWVLKVDATGNIQWQKAWGGTGNDQCFSISATPDGGCIATGTTASTNGDLAGNLGMTDAWVVKLSSTGTLQWQRLIGGSQQDGGLRVRPTPDGGYIMAGYAGSNDGNITGGDHGGWDFLVIRFDNNGIQQWQKCYGGGTGNERAFDIQSTPDGGYLVAGDAESHDGDLSCNAGVTTDAWIIKIDATGGLVWSKSMGGSYYELPFSIQPLADGGCIFAAETCSDEIPGYHSSSPPARTCGDYWIVRLSPPVSSLPPVSVTLSPLSGKICAGMPATFTATVIDAGVSPRYAWTKNGLSVGTNSPYYSASDLKDGDLLSVAVVAGTGVCDNYPGQTSASLTIHENSNILHPDIKITSGSSYICGCAPVTFKATVTNGGSQPQYQWMLNGVAAGGTSDTWLCNGLQPGDLVTCEYSDLSGCIANAPLISNTITLNAGAGQPATVTISGPSDEPCAGTSITFTASPVNAGTNPVFRWKINGIDAGANSTTFTSQILVNGDRVTCTVTPDLSNTCTVAGDATSNTLIVALKDKASPAVSVSPTTGVACKGLPLAFKATVMNGGNIPAYQWQINGADAGTNSPDFSQVFDDGDVVQCTITADPTYSCALTTTATSSPITVQVLDQPTPSVSITADEKDVCAGSPIRFDAVLSDAGTGSTIQWMVNGAPLKDRTSTLISRQLQDNDMITCAVTPGAGACVTTPVVSNAIQVTVHPLPAVIVSPADTIVLYGGQAILHVKTSPDVVSWQWTPAYLLESTQTLNAATMPLREDVTFYLTVATSHPCYATASAAVRIYRALSMPGAFSPNGDGFNDVFRIPPGITLDLKEFSIFNRWGDRVFSTRNIGRGWDGTVGGRPAGTGTYVYVITGTDLKGPVLMKGTVVLVR